MPNKSHRPRRNEAATALNRAAGAPPRPNKPMSLRLSESELRAEAAYQVLTLLIERLPDRERRYLAARTLSELVQAGLPEIEVEAMAMFIERTAEGTTV